MAILASYGSTPTIREKRRAFSINCCIGPLRRANGQFLYQSIALQEWRTGRVHSKRLESTTFIWRFNMRQVFLLVSVLLLGLSWAIAQETPSQGSSSASGSSAQTSDTSAGG